MIVTFGMVACFCMIVILILQRSFVADKSFTDYAVGGRSFGGVYQAMSFLNTWYPGATFIALAGLSASAGVLGLYCLAYSLLTVVLMYLIARRVWIWGSMFDLRTQPDLFALRYGSTHARTIAAIIGVVSVFPWLVLGFQSLGVAFRALSLGALSFSAAVVVGVVLMVDPTILDHSHGHARHCDIGHVPGHSGLCCRRRSLARNDRLARHNSWRWVG